MVVRLRLDHMTHGAQFRARVLRDHGRSGALDPVLGVDHAYMGGPTFPPHPHAGFSAVSYVFSDAETGLNNRDSIGTINLIRPGGLHWTAAGRGIVHEETPADSGKVAHLFQIFIDLPVTIKNAAPFAISLEPEDVPVVQRNGALIRVPLGHFEKFSSPLETPTRITLLDITLDAGATLQVPLDDACNAFVIPVHGSISINGMEFDVDGEDIPAFPAASQSQHLILEANSSSAQAAVFFGLPISLQA